MFVFYIYTYLHYMGLHLTKTFTILNSQALKSVLVSIDLLRLWFVSLTLGYRFWLLWRLVNGEGAI
jgi:hypothetical protein